MMAALLRHGVKRIGGSVLQRTQAAAQALVPRSRRMTTITTRAPEEMTRDIKRKQQDLADQGRRQESQIFSVRGGR